MQANIHRKLMGCLMAALVALGWPMAGWSKTHQWDTQADWSGGTANNTTWQKTPGQVEIVFDPNSVKKTPFIYLPNSGLNTVVQMDTRTGVINWTYNLAPLNLGSNPSRTTVDSKGNVWVGLRNGNQVVALTQQGKFLANANVGSGPRAVTIDLDGNIWAGGYNSNSITKISGTTYKILQVVRDAGICTYGATADSIGNIWTLNRCKGTITKIEAKTGRIIGHYTATQGYGIAADRKGHVWVGAYATGLALRFRASDGKLLSSYALGARGRGVSIDAQDRAWVACSHSSSGTITRHLARIDPTTGKVDKFTNVGLHTIGVAIDSAGFAWANSYSEGKAYVLKVTDGSFVAAYNLCDTTGTRPCANTGCSRCLNTNQSQPYTYSDMTGFQLQVSPSQGTWTAIFDATCKAKFTSMGWNGSTPTKTTVQVRARSAATRAGLSGATWGPYVNKGANLQVPNNRFLQIQFLLKSQDSRITPVITNAALTYDHFAEVCDGQDNDCNGSVDETFANKGQSCSNGKGICAKQGKFVCKADGSGTVCDAKPGPPAAEVCDGKDNDCDGQTDEDFPQKGTPCGIGQGECLNKGTLVCPNGKIVCSASPLPPKAEVCDGKDNDCDGQTDENLFKPCSTACGSGRQVCKNGTYAKCDAKQPSPEVCDDQDNNCDGLVDNGLTRTCKTACGEGTERCVNGSYKFCTARQPSAEVCDGVDNDCNGKTDDNIPPQKCQGACGQGTATCQNGKFTGCSGPQPKPEVCDGKDNDCDGKTDGFTEECSSKCGTGRKLCQNGQWLECSAPRPQPEFCDGKDNDCDGKVDNNAQCPSGAICKEGTCRLKCRGGECPGGAACVEELCEGDLCKNVKCEGGRICLAGRCTLPCDLIKCDSGYACDAGKCVKDDCYRNGCPAKQRCVRGTCEADPCIGVSCSSDQFCRDGQCIDSCAKVTCTNGEKCVDGKCQKDPETSGPCKDVTCPNGQRCVQGNCLPDPCRDIKCNKGRICIEGVCDHDPCSNIKCPSGQNCTEGQCTKGSGSPEPTTEPASPDAGPSPDTPKGKDETPTKDDKGGNDAVAAQDKDNPESKTTGNQNKPDGPGSGRYVPGCGCHQAADHSVPLSLLLLALFALGFFRRRNEKSL